MPPRALQRLVDAARALPGEKVALPRRWPVRMEAPAEDGGGAAPTGGGGESLRRRVGDLLGELSRRLDPALTGALRRATTAWDQVDTVAVIDPPLAAAAAALRREAEALRASDDPAIAAAGLEALLTVATATDLVALLERRLATLCRLRLRSADRDLVPAGRPFLDLAAALAEAARGWR